jgi:hypothetical protein
VKAVEIAAIQSAFSLDRDTGIITNATNRRRARAGDVVGTERPDGYKQVCINGTILLLHRVVFALANGRWSDLEIDHINGDRSDNRPANLREATKSQNGANKRLCRMDGLKGASFCRRSGKWRSSLRKDGKYIHIGLFDTAESAHIAYVTAARRYHGEFARAA